MAATLEEWLLAAEYIMAEGNYNVILCERGVRTFAQHTRNTLDLASVPAIRRISHLPVIVDPSHGTGTAYMVTPLAQRRRRSRRGRPHDRSPQPAGARAFRQRTGANAVAIPSTRHRSSSDSRACLVSHMTKIEKGISAAPNRREAAVATALWAVSRQARISIE